MMNLLGIGELVSGVGKVADDLFTSDEERLRIALAEKTLEVQLVQGQLEINKTEALHTSIFVAGWRPAIGWIGAAALAYQFILYPLLVWGWTMFQANGWVPTNLAPPPVLDSEALWVLLTGMLGIAGLRSFDKFKGTDTSQVGGSASK
jgi:Holin of 3TMs, for gene-transfer release